eukprot:1160471-Pelagomonas_calceolata.AAC.7
MHQTKVKLRKRRGYITHSWHEECMLPTATCTFELVAATILKQSSRILLRGDFADRTTLSGGCVVGSLAFAIMHSWTGSQGLVVLCRVDSRRCLSLWSSTTAYYCVSVKTHGRTYSTAAYPLLVKAYSREHTAQQLTSCLSEHATEHQPWQLPPGSLETLARRRLPVSMFIREDLPTLDLPITANSAC